MFSLFSHPLSELEEVYMHWVTLPHSSLHDFRSCPATVNRVEWCHLLCDWINRRYSDLLYSEISAWFQINHIFCVLTFPNHRLSDGACLAAYSVCSLLMARHFRDIFVCLLDARIFTFNCLFICSGIGNSTRDKQHLRSLYMSYLQKEGQLKRIGSTPRYQTGKLIPTQEWWRTREGVLVRTSKNFSNRGRGSGWMKWYHRQELNLKNNTRT